MSQNIAGLQRQFCVGQTLLFVVGDRVYHRLLKPTEFHGAAPVNILKSHLSDEPVALIDVKAAFEALTAELERDKCQPTGNVPSSEKLVTT